VAKKKAFLRWKDIRKSILVSIQKYSWNGQACSLIRLHTVFCSEIIYTDKFNENVAWHNNCLTLCDASFALQWMWCLVCNLLPTWCKLLWLPSAHVEEPVQQSIKYCIMTSGPKYQSGDYLRQPCHGDKGPMNTYFTPLYRLCVTSYVQSSFTCVTLACC
jgi:hypothetical protein